MFKNVSFTKIIILLICIYSVVITAVYVSNKNYSVSDERIEQLNAQIIQQNNKITQLEKEDDDVKAIRSLLEKERADKEAAQSFHQKATAGMWEPDKESLKKFKRSVLIK